MLKKILVTAGALMLSACSLGLPVGSNQDSGAPGSVWKSTDGGVNFQPKIKVRTEQGEEEMVSVDVLSISFHPTDTNTAYVGTVESGIFKTTDGAETWEQMFFPPKKVYSFTADKKDPNRLFATGVYENRGKVYRSLDGGANWKDVYTEPGTGTVIISLAEHPVDTNVIFAGTSAGTVVKSVDGGDTWLNVGGTVDGPVLKILFDATKPLHTYLLVFNMKMYYSSDGGRDWIDWEKVKQEEQQRRSEEASRRGKFEDLQKQFEAEEKRRAPQTMVSLTADPRISGLLYAGTAAEGLFRSTDSGKFWDPVNVIESAKKFPLRDLAIHPSNSDEMVFSTGKAFYKTVNRGETWSVSSLNIDRPVSTIVYDPLNPGTLYFGLRKY